MTIATKAPRMTRELLEATAAYLLARAKEETLRAIDHKMQTELLASFSIPYTPEQSYQMSEEQSAVYYPALDAAWRTAGFTDMPEGHSPYLMAKTALCDAENAMLDAAVQMHGKQELKAENLWGENRAKAIDLTCRLVASY